MNKKQVDYKSITAGTHRNGLLKQEAAQTCITIGPFSSFMCLSNLSYG